MDIYLLDENFATVQVYDIFESFLWTDRYNGYGDCEIYTPVDMDIWNKVTPNRYLWSGGSDHVMIIDERTITSDVDSGNRILIRGRSLESILDRRIVWTQTTITGSFQAGIQKLLNENVINPTMTSRRIPNFVFQASTDSRITSMTITAQFTGNNLYEVITELCADRGLGFKIILNSSNQFVFSLYMGTDHSYNQDNNPYVVFSPKYDNILNSNYFETTRVLKTTALIAGEGEGLERRTATVGGGSGLERREAFVDARDISSTRNEPDEEMTDAEYTALLEQRGHERMAENVFVKTFDGEIEATQMFVYGEDFYLGDVVQIVNEYGVEAGTRIIELIFSNGDNGDNIVPTFQVIEE